MTRHTAWPIPLQLLELLSVVLKPVLVFINFFVQTSRFNSSPEPSEEVVPVNGLFNEPIGSGLE
ncbi:MAG TPA: hypothetical protein VFH31_13840 [Pyrinomonadaceae bacterium]|nr:hypothetical protein [Pyrinomonadaceae bacterium]